MRPEGDLTDLVVHVHQRTKAAVLVSDDGERTRAVWLPLAAIELSMRRGSDTVADITLQERLAIEKGLV